MNIFRFKKLKNWKIVLIVLLGITILGIGQIKIAHAFSLFSIADITANAVSAVAQAIGYILGFIGGVFMAIAGYLVTLALNINFALLKSPVVQTGWQIVLNFTNLGFVLAIIVMAFATIFRVQTYAMKKTLWKLIVAALLVNFSLVIAGAFINISDIFSNFFLKQGGIRDPVEWSKAFAAMFRAQALLKVGETFAAQGFVDTATGAINTFGAAGLQTIASVFFIALFTILACLTLLAVAVMLLIRYVFLGILLILSPIVWLLWIFPGTQHLWQKWWSQFLRWTFFAPIVLFFISLSLYAMKNQPEAVRQFTQNSAAVANVQLTFGVEVIGEMVIVIALVMGGLFAANSLGITFASTAYGWAGSIGKSFGGWVGRKGIQLGTGPLRGKWGTKAIEAIEKFGATRGRLLKTVTAPIRTQVGERLGKLAATGAEKSVADAEQRYKDYDDKRLAKMIYSLDAPERVAALQRLRKNKTLDLLPDTSAFINKETKDLFVRYGQPEPDYTAMERTVGYNTEMLGALKAGDTGKLEEAAKAFYKDFRPEHFTKMQIDEFFKKTPELGLKTEKEKEDMHKAVVKAVLETNPDGLANIYRGIKGRNLDNFNKILFGFIDEQVKKTGEKGPREWLESDLKYARVLTFFDSPAAQSLGISIGPKKEEKKTTLYDQFGRPIT